MRAQHSAQAQLAGAVRARARSRPATEMPAALRAFEGYSGSGLQFKGFEPLGEPGDRPFPAYVFYHGTTLGISPSTLALARYMASLGFVAAAATYPEPDFYNPGTCAYFESKAAQLHSAGGPVSAVCGRERANCSAGLAIAGFSQGAHLAALAARFEPRVTAALLIGGGYKMTGVWTDARNYDGTYIPPRQALTCLADAAVSAHLPRSKRRAVVGENDEWFGIAPTPPRVLAQHRALSGYDCGARRDCIQPDGSGFYVVSAAESGTDGGHAFWRAGPQLHPTFERCSASWCMRPSLDWLAAAARLQPDEEVGREDLAAACCSSAAAERWAGGVAAALAVVGALGFGLRRARRRKREAGDGGFA